MVTTALSLKEIQLKLGAPAHVLIHLCEKDVVVPDILNAKGRGSMRLFSERNLFEFQIALTLRKFEIPVRIIAVVTRLLREFETAVSGLQRPATRPTFELPRSLLEKGSPRVILNFVDGRLLAIQLAAKRHSTFLGVDIDKSGKTSSKRVSIERLKELPANYETCLSINLTTLALKSAGVPRKRQVR